MVGKELRVEHVKKACSSTVAKSQSVSADIMTIVLIVLAVVMSTVDSSCPYGGASMSSSVRAFYLTNGVYDDIRELEQESKQLTGSPWTREVQRICNAHKTCDPGQKYRSFDGTCNNLRKPAVGSRGQCHERILPASYIDGISEPAKGVPIVEIFNALQSRTLPPSPPQTAMFAMIQQFFVHDISETAIANLDNNYDCCAKKNRELEKCSLRINTENAMHYKNHSIKCMSFVRAARCPCSHDRARRSMNLQTSYIDLSHVYLDGSNRLPGTPYLKTTHSELSGEFPQLDPEPAVCYADDSRCFKGDGRMNQQQGISLHHIVFERQHNFIARRLAKINPAWDSEIVFQEARKILIARWQYVYCNEVISMVLDKKLSRDAKIHIDQLMEGTEVDPDAETVTLSESVHSEFRNHYIVPNSIGDHELLWLNSGKYFTEEDFLDRTLKGQLYEPQNSWFPMQPKTAYNFLKAASEPIGLSMIMINIQRGRDTGVASFRRLVEWAFNTSIHSFEDISKFDIFGKEELELLKKLYPTVDDIDMWVGGHLQKGHPGTGMGAFTHQKIRIAQHYGHIYGDRFFFSHKGVFSRKQREAIAKSSSYAQMLCEVMNLDLVPEDVFELRFNNTGKPCASFERLDLTLWKA